MKAHKEFRVLVRNLPIFNYVAALIFLHASSVCLGANRIDPTENPAGLYKIVGNNDFVLYVDNGGQVRARYNNKSSASTNELFNIREFEGDLVLWHEGKKLICNNERQGRLVRTLSGRSDRRESRELRVEHRYRGDNYYYIPAGNEGILAISDDYNENRLSDVFIRADNGSTRCRPSEVFEVLLYEPKIAEDQYLLAEIYRKNYKDTDSAILWYKRALDNGYEPAQKKLDELERDMRNRLDENIQINRKMLGVGGLDKQVDTLLQELILPLKLKKCVELDIRPTRGILLYGEPGTGKTWIVNNIIEMFPEVVSHIVNGSDLDSDQKVTDLFSEAQKEPLKHHLFIFDEIDSMGSRSSNSNLMDDKILAQLLTAIDGLQSHPNFTVIGMTNRENYLEKALIRSGRFETHILLPLPNEKGRTEILEMCFKKSREKGFTVDIDSKYWGNFLQKASPADIKALAERAERKALAASYVSKGNNYCPKNGRLCKINDEIFREAYNDSLPNICLRENNSGSYGSPCKQGQRPNKFQNESTNHNGWPVLGYGDKWGSDTHQGDYLLPSSSRKKFKSDDR